MTVASFEAKSQVSKPMPPPPPAALEETGLHPDTLGQLMLKTLVAGEASGTGNAGYRYALTDLGRDRAMQFLDINRYVGAAPVPLAQYSSIVGFFARIL